MLAQCACQKGVSKGGAESAPKTSKTATVKDTKTSVKAAPKVVLPSSLDLKDLDVDERKLLHSVLKDQFDPCGKPISFLKSLMEKTPCKRAVEMGTFVVDLVTKGFGKKQITVSLLKKLKQIHPQHL